VDRVLRIMERRARLLGLDAPHNVNVSAAEPLQIVLRWEDQADEGT